MNSDSDKFRQFGILGTRFQLPLTGRDSEVKERIILEGTLMFTQKGYAGVSIKQVAEQAGVDLTEAYKHFPTKEVLWKMVLNHAVDLYLLYFRQLDEAINKAGSFEEVLEILFFEPKKFNNYFTCFAFGLIQAEQFHDKLSGEIFKGVFLDYSIKFIKDRFDRCVEQGLAQPFDTRTVATLFMNSILISINVKVHEILGRPTPYDPAELITNMQTFILTALGREPKPPTQAAEE